MLMLMLVANNNGDMGRRSFITLTTGPSSHLNIGGYQSGFTQVSSSDNQTGFTQVSSSDNCCHQTIWRELANNWRELGFCRKSYWVSIKVPWRLQ